MQDITSGAHALTILGIEVRADEHGRYSLNDLHRAAMVAAGRAGDPNRDHQRPALFLRTASVKSFIAAIDAESVDAQKCASTIKGGKAQSQGTYAAELVVMRYAGWISPEFEIKAYRALKQLHDAERAGIPSGIYSQALAAEKDEARSAAIASEAAKIMRRRRDDKPVLAEKLALMREVVQLCLALTRDSAD